jgi:arylsulfatase
MEEAPPHRTYSGRVDRSIERSEPFWDVSRRAREGAPNVVLILCDDLGFSDLGCYGSEIPTPNLDALASAGTRFVDYHVTPLCSPTRAALLTGVNPHRAGVGFLANEDHGFPGYGARLVAEVSTAAEIFRANGYATFAVGKWHLTPRSETSAAGDRSSWPLQRGFDRYFGYQGGLTNWHHPHLLYEDNHVVEVDRYPDGYYLADDLTSRASRMIRDLRSVSASKPFFLYLAHGAVHAPLQAKDDDLARHRGRYDLGWTHLREERYARQIHLGVTDPTTRLAPPNLEKGFDVHPWEDLSESERAFAARQMETYAAMVDNLDQNVGRVCDVLREVGELKNTIFVFASDNGASWGGGPFGTTAYLSHGYRAGDGSRPSETELTRTGLIGSARVLTHYARGWAMVSNTPFRLYKETTFAGGHQVPLIISWPSGLPGRGTIRRQYAYVTDVLPTLVDLVDLEIPRYRHGERQLPMSGTSLRSVLVEPDAPSRHEEQYYESAGHRGFYRRGWEVVTLHTPGAPFDDNEWQLFHVAGDPTELTDLAEKEPSRLEELATAWDDAAWANGVFPLGDAANGLYQLRPPGADGPRTVRLTPAHHTLDPNVARLLVRSRSFHIDVRFDHRAGDEGVILAHGDQGGGYVLFVERDTLWFAVNDSLDVHTLDGGPLASPTREVTLEVTAHGLDGWDVTLSVEGVERGRLAALPPWTGHTPFEGIDIGIDRRSPVVWELYEKHGPFPFSGQIESVTYSE